MRSKWSFELESTATLRSNEALSWSPERLQVQMEVRDGVNLNIKVPMKFWDGVNFNTKVRRALREGVQLKIEMKVIDGVVLKGQGPNEVERRNQAGWGTHREQRSTRDQCRCHARWMSTNMLCSACTSNAVNDAQVKSISKKKSRNRNKRNTKLMKGIEECNARSVGGDAPQKHFWRDMRNPAARWNLDQVKLQPFEVKETGKRETKEESRFHCPVINQQQRAPETMPRWESSSRTDEETETKK